jgi:hypothetical protein
MDLLQKLLASAEKCGNRITSHDCDIITLEPGDGVHYEFAIINKNFYYIIIAGIETNFQGYEFRKDSIKLLFDEIGKPPQYKDYHKWASKVCHNQNHYLKYVIESVGGIATVNPFTALAAMYAGFIYLKTEVLP